MDDTTRSNEPVKEPVEDNTVNTPDPDHNLPDPLQTPELPGQTMTDEELDASLPVVRNPEKEDNSASQE